MAKDFISDEEMVELEAQQPDFISDEEMTVMESPGVAKEIDKAKDVGHFEAATASVLEALSGGNYAEGMGKLSSMIQDLPEEEQVKLYEIRQKAAREGFPDTYAAGEVIGEVLGLYGGAKVAKAAGKGAIKGTKAMIDKIPESYKKIVTGAIHTLPIIGPATERAKKGVSAVRHARALEKVGKKKLPAGKPYEKPASKIKQLKDKAPKKAKEVVMPKKGPEKPEMPTMTHAEKLQKGLDKKELPKGKPYEKPSPVSKPMKKEAPKKLEKPDMPKTPPKKPEMPAMSNAEKIQRTLDKKKLPLPKNIPMSKVNKDKEVLSLMDRLKQGGKEVSKAEIMRKERELAERLRDKEPAAGGKWPYSKDQTKAMSRSRKQGMKGY